jgi:hypothetical protein
MSALCGPSKLSTPVLRWLLFSFQIAFIPLARSLSRGSHGIGQFLEECVHAANSWKSFLQIALKLR